MYRKNFLLPVMIAAWILLFAMISCSEEKMPAPPTAPAGNSLTEEFDTVAALPNKGWVLRDNSTPGGFYQWTQGYNYFVAYSYKWNAFDYAACDFSAGTGVSTLSVWMITPPLNAKNGDVVSFYTSAVSGSSYPDRMQFRANFTDDNPDLGGNTSTHIGNFNTVIFDINPTLSSGGYPTRWTKYSYTITQLSATTKKIRFAFRYYVPGGGTMGSNSFYIGVDKFEFVSN